LQLFPFLQFRNNQITWIVFIFKIFSFFHAISPVPFPSANFFSFFSFQTVLTLSILIPFYFHIHYKSNRPICFLSTFLCAYFLSYSLYVLFNAMIYSLISSLFIST
jgi:hypothetical protein